jgi:hypothetical protein
VVSSAEDRAMFADEGLACRHRDCDGDADPGGWCDDHRPDGDTDGDGYVWKRWARAWFEADAEEAA